jgi:hypothetical protein
MSFSSRELQTENIENFENLENLENMENTENMEEEANLSLSSNIGPSSCEIGSTTDENVNGKQTQTTQSKARRLQTENTKSQEGGEEVNFQGYGGDGSCEIDEICKRKFIFGLGFIIVCKNIISCEVGEVQNNVGIMTTEQVCQTVRKCSCVVRPGIGSVQICRNQLVCA